MTRPLTRLAAAIAAVVAALALATPAEATSPWVQAPWVDAWASSPQQADNGIPDFPVGEPLENVTVRLIVHPHTSGPAVRIKLSNVFGDRPLVVAKATIAKRTTGASVDAKSVRALTFGGRTGVTIPAGADQLSDP